MIEIGSKLLITTDNWFIAPDGNQYRAVFGTVKGIHQSEGLLGIKVNSRSQDWYLQIGCMTVAGCQIHYACETEDLGKDPTVSSWNVDKENGYYEYTHPNDKIFNADEA